MAGVMIAGAASAADNRTLDLYNTHTKERLTITFKKNGKFVPSSLKELNRFLRDWRRNEPTNMDPRLFDTVWEVYTRSKSRQPIHVVSGYRSLATNNMLRSKSSAVAKHSQHTLGKAMDFFLPDVKVSTLREIGIGMQRGGVGFYPTANTPFVHIDVGSVRAWPRMTRSQLVRIFPDGKTVHLPADGKPLPGYQQALAEMKRNGTASRPLAIAEEGSGKRKGGLLAMLFGDEEDASEELNAASTTGQSLTAGDDEAPAKAAPAPAPVVVAAAPPPPAPAKPAEPAVTSLADATLPGVPAPNAPTTAQPVAVAAIEPPPPPRKRPAELIAAVEANEATEVEFAAVDPSALPRPRPVIADELPAVQVAEAAPALPPLPTVPGQPANAQLALAEVARDPAAAPGTDTLLGYASPTADAAAVPVERKPFLSMASLTPGTALRSVRGPDKPAATASGPSTALKTDPLAEMARPRPPTDLPVYDGSVSTYRGSFARLVHPNQRSGELLFTSPTVVVQASFDRRPYGSMSSQGFSGVALTRLPVLTFRIGRDYASR